MQRVTPLKTDRHDQKTPYELLELWRIFLQENDHAPGTVKKYTQAVIHFLAWYEHEERVPLHLLHLTPIALIGYRNELQHEMHLSISTINAAFSNHEIATQRFALGAIFVYQLALWYRFEHDLELCVGLKAFLKAA